MPTFDQATAHTISSAFINASASLPPCLPGLDAAMALLQDPELQVSEVAARCGYDSHSRFSAVFRERFGFAPSHLRP